MPLGSSESGRFARDADVSGGIAYVGETIGSVDNGPGWLRVIDVSSPDNPVELGTLPIAGGVVDVEVAGHVAYAATFAPGLTAIDVSDPSRPVELGSITTSGSAEDVEVVDGLAYLADGVGGLRIIDFGPEYAGPLPAPRYLASIDVKPGNRRNRLNPSRRGLVKVAILGSQALAVEQIDLAALKFGPHGANPSGASGIRDVNGDGSPDLVARFRVQETGLARGDGQACLHGRLLDGTRFEGCDAVWTPPPR
jgi:hypothetical protein